MKMTPTVIIVGILSLLAAITLTMVYWPYTTRVTEPSEIFRERTAVEAAGRKIYLENGCVYCHSQSIRSIDWGHGSDRIAQPGDYRRSTAGVNGHKNDKDDQSGATLGSYCNSDNVRR